MTREEHETLHDLIVYLYDFARKQDDDYGKWDWMSRQLERILDWLSGGELDDNFFYDSPDDCTKPDVFSVIDMEHINKTFQQYHEQQDEQDIKNCPNANPDKGICPAARDTFLKMWSQILGVDISNVLDSQSSTLIRDYMTGKGRLEE